MKVIEHNKSIHFFGQKITLNTGKYARQAAGSAWITMNDTSLLVTATRSDSPREGNDFLPLTVDVQEKYYAVGKVPGGFFKREGRPSESAQLLSRLIDRPIRPLFPKGFSHDIHVVANIFSYDLVSQPDVLGILGASLALGLSDIPFEGPVAAVRVGMVDGKVVINPDPVVIKEKSQMDILVASGRQGILMVEGEAKEVSEEQVAQALFQANEANQMLIEFQETFVGLVGPKQKLLVRQKPEISWPSDFHQALKKHIGIILAETDKLKRQDVSRVANAAIDTLIEESPAFSKLKETHGSETLISEASALFKEKLSESMRQMILSENKRVDGRKTTAVRSIWGETGLLPRVHGSAIFTRGETQVMAAVTLGGGEDEQTIDSIHGRYGKSFMLHYNFPPFCVGETGPLRSPGRREIGHGTLAERAIKAILPDPLTFPYTIRLVSEVLESNGSSSMGTVCSGSLALMDAGVPIKTPVAGVAMGLIQHGEQTAILTDILGDEDHLGDMDFKVAGTHKGITAIQMDIKVSGLTHELMMKALNQAREGRLHILKEMGLILDKPKEEMSPYAPQMIVMQINPQRIKDLIGTGGKNIKGIIEATGVKIDVDDSGRVRISAVDKSAISAAVDRVKGLTTDPEVGQVFVGKVRKIMEYGAFVDILPNVSGLVHISELANERVKRVEDICREGDDIEVKIVEIDRTGRIRLSRKAILNSPSPSDKV
jgi:polyribonucleotide nucleotidyltransferase